MRLVCDGVGHTYRGGAGDLVALEDVTIESRPAEFVCIVGPSGCGKSTLLRLIAGLHAPSSGSIRFHGGTPGTAPRNALVFQEHGVFPWMTVIENVAFGLEMQGVRKSERLEQARAFIERVGLTTFERSYPHELSVGMRQRVGIARAFVADVPVLLMDEPFGSLDAQTKWVLQEELLRIWREDRKLVLFVTHDIQEAVRLGDRVVVMTGRPGRVREIVEIPFPRPRDPDRDAAESARLTRHIWNLLKDDVRTGLLVKE